MSIREKIRGQTKKKPPKVARARSGGGPDNSGLEKKLIVLLTNDDLVGATEVWRQGMSANKFAWSQKEQAFVDTGFPDWDVRERMAAKVAAYKDGLPVAKQVIISGSFEDFGALLDRYRQSDEAMRPLMEVNPPTKTPVDEASQP